MYHDKTSDLNDELRKVYPQCIAKAEKSRTKTEVTDRRAKTKEPWLDGGRLIEPQRGSAMDEMEKVLGTWQMVVWSAYRSRTRTLA